MAELVRVGSLPVAAINVGLTASLPGIAAQVTKLTAEASELALSLAAQTEVALDFPPNPLSMKAGVTAALNPVELGAALLAFNPTGSADVSLDATAKLAAVTAQLEVVEPLSATLTGGLESGGCAGFSYSGPALPFGTELERYTAGGFGTTGPNAQIQAVIFATESFASWGALSKSINTGASARAEASPDSPRLAFLGELPGRSWNPGVAQVSAGIDALLADLRGAKSGIESQLEIAVGVGLPDPQVVVDAGAAVVADVGIDGLVDNMVNVRADISGAISDVNARIDATLAVSADIASQLSAGGLTVWTYTGPASGLGAALARALESGIPGGTGARAPAYGLVIAGTPANMLALGTIVRTS